MSYYIPKTWTLLPQWRGQLCCPACTAPFGECDGVESHKTEAERVTLWKHFYPGIDFTGFVPDKGQAAHNLDIAVWRRAYRLDLKPGLVTEPEPNSETRPSPEDVSLLYLFFGVVVSLAVAIGLSL